MWFAGTQSEITHLNLEDRITNIETTINIWKGRCLSLKGKITIIKTTIVPQVQFLFSMIHIEDITIKRIEKKSCIISYGQIMYTKLRRIQL